MKRTRLSDKKDGFAHVELLVVTGVFAILSIVALNIYQHSANTKYSYRIKSAYPQQARAMSHVYESFGRPVFASNDGTPESEKQDLLYVNNVIAHATDETNKLESANRLHSIPGIQKLANGEKI